MVDSSFSVGMITEISGGGISEGRAILSPLDMAGQDRFLKNSLKRLQMGVVYRALWPTV